MTRPITSESKATAVCDAVKGGEQTRGSVTLTITDGPALVDGGVEVWVRVTEDGVDLRVDPHRVFINPPTQVVTDNRVGVDVGVGRRIDRVTRYDPAEAFWSVLWDSVTATPNTRGRRSK